MRPAVLPTNLLSPDALADCHTTFSRLRAAGPVVWLPEHRAWLLTSYRAVLDGFRDERLSSDRLTPMIERRAPETVEVLQGTFDLLRGWMVFHDPPEHERLREPLRRTFTPRRMEQLRVGITDIVDGLVDELTDSGSEAAVVDLVAEFAAPLPAIVIAELLGVPASDREDFKTWSDQLATIVFGATQNPEQAREAAEGSARFADYFTDLINHYRRTPGDNLVTDLISVTDSRDADGAPRLTAIELVGALTLLLFAGHETTTTLIANSCRSLIANPTERAWLVEHPDEIENAVEELHRYEGSTKLMVRVVAEDHMSHGMSLSAGQTVFLGTASANRDAAMFDQPDELELRRPNASRHLGFGHGSHFCLGAALARIETQIALNGFVRRFPNASAAGAPEPGESLLNIGLKRLPATLG